MLVNNLVGVVAVLAGVALGLLGVAPDPAPAPLAEVAGILTSPRLSCGFECSRCLVSIEHRVEDGGGEDSGVDHDCIDTGFLGCEDFHSCGGFARAEVARLVELLPLLTGDDLRALRDEAVGLIVDPDGWTIQVLGCNDLAVVSMTASAEQMAGLADA